MIDSEPNQTGTGRTKGTVGDEGEAEEGQGSAPALPAPRDSVLGPGVDVAHPREQQWLFSWELFLPVTEGVLSHTWSCADCCSPLQLPVGTIPSRRALKTALAAPLGSG